MSRSKIRPESAKPAATAWSAHVAGSNHHTIVATIAADIANQLCRPRIRTRYRRLGLRDHRNCRTAGACKLVRCRIRGAPGPHRSGEPECSYRHDAHYLSHLSLPDDEYGSRCRRLSVSVHSRSNCVRYLTLSEVKCASRTCTVAWGAALLLFRGEVRLHVRQARLHPTMMHVTRRRDGTRANITDGLADRMQRPAAAGPPSGRCHQPSISGTGFHLAVLAAQTAAGPGLYSQHKQPPDGVGSP
jgi:hypothetical protein